MVRHFLSTTLILILTLFITTDIPAEIDSVLTLVPEDAIGFVYIPSLLGLNDEVNTLLTELVPVDPPQEIIAKSLAGTFGARFETLEELEEIGFDLRKDFAVFLTDMNPPIPSAVVHLKDADMVKQLIETEAEGSQAVIYKDMTYHTTDEEGAFVLLEDVMVYSNTPKICEKAIDTYKKVEDSIVTNADYASLKLDMTSGTNDLVGYLVMEPLVEIIRRRLTEAVDEMKAVMEAEGETDPQLAEGLRMFPKLVNRVISLLNQSKTLSLSFQLNGSELQISPFLKFKSDSEVQRYISQSPTELTQLNNLPQTAFLNGGMRVQSKDMIRLTIGMMKLFTPSDPNVDGEQIKKASQEFTKTVTAFYKFVGDEVSFSVNFSGSLVPDISLVYDASDEKKAKAYMDEEFLAYLKAGQSFYQAMGAEEYSGMYEGASARPAEMYDGVEIKSYALPSMGSAVAQLAPEMQGLVPEQWNLYYAIKGGKLIHSMSANAGPIKDVLDLIGVAGAGFDKGAGYDKLTDALTLKNNMLIAISPIAAVKNIIQLVAQTDPNIGPLMTLLGNIPEAYSIGIASQNRDGGVEGKLFISLGDFKELINMAASMQEMQAKNSADAESKFLYMGLSIYYLHQAGEKGKIEELAPGSFVREAESADTIPDMFQVEDDENASGGQFLWRPEGATSGSGNVALYNFTIPEAGTYKIIARTFATDDKSDSFYVKFDDSKRYYTWHTAIWSEWNWEVLTGQGHRSDHAGADSYINRPIRFPLSVGEHQFQLRTREDGTRLDVLVFYREETMTQQLQAVENNPDAPYSMAKIYKAYGMYDEAITAYEKAAELSPDEKHILEPLAKLYADSDLPGWQARALKAKAIYKHLIGLAQTSYDRTRYRRQLLDLHKQLGEIDAAVTMLRDAAHSAPELLEGGAAALRGIWKLYTDAGRSSEGVKMLEVLASQMEESSLLHEVLGDIYKQMGDSAKAKAAYTKSFELRRQETSPDGNVQSKAQYMGELIYHLHRVGERDKIAEMAPGSFVREAESADLITGMFQIETDESASEGKFVWAPKGTSSYWHGPIDSGDVIFDITIPEKGTYQIIARVSAESGSNSFFVNFGDSEYRRWEISNMSKWNWQALTIYPSNQAARFFLSAGEHKLKLKVREDGTRLDALVFYRL